MEGKELGRQLGLRGAGRWADLGWGEGRAEGPLWPHQPFPPELS